jgi:hypothetical protein
LVRPRYHPKEEHLRGASLGYTPSLLANNRLGWKGLSGSKTTAYYEHS